MRLCQMYNGLISYICSMYEKNPEEETFKTFFLKYHDVLVLYAASILKNVDAAEDVVLGCFVQAWESSLYKKLSDGLDKYMFHVVKNAALNELRDCKRRKTRHEKMMEGMPVAEIMHEDEQTEIDVLYFAINQLPPERRRIFMMVYAEGKKYKEVAEHLQISINTVRTQLSRSLKFLREKLEGHMFTILLLCFRKSCRYTYLNPWKRVLFTGSKIACNLSVKKLNELSCNIFVTERSFLFLQPQNSES